MACMLVFMPDSFKKIKNTSCELAIFEFIYILAFSFQLSALSSQLLE